MCSPNDDIYLPHSTKTICDQIIMDHYYYTHRGTKEEHVDAIVVVHPRILATGTHSPTFSTFFLPMSQQHTSNGNTFTHVPHIFLPMSQQRQYLYSMHTCENKNITIPVYSHDVCMERKGGNNLGVHNSSRSEEDVYNVSLF
jgi:hypothetical protein